MSDRIIRVSEISQYVYCRRSWWLHRVAGYQSRNQAAMVQGTAYHRRHAVIVRQASWFQRTALVFLFLAILVIAFWLVWLS